MTYPRKLNKDGEMQLPLWEVTLREGKVLYEKSMIISALCCQT